MNESNTLPEAPAGLNWGDIVLGFPMRSSYRYETVHLGRLEPPKRWERYKIVGLCSEYISKRTGKPNKSGQKRLRFVGARTERFNTLMLEPDERAASGFVIESSSLRYKASLCRFCYTQYEQTAGAAPSGEDVNALVEASTTRKDVIAAASGLKTSQITAARKLMINRVNQLKNEINIKYRDHLQAERNRLDEKYSDTAKLEAMRQSSRRSCSSHSFREPLPRNCSP